MKLSKKTFFYSILMAVVLVLFVVLYFAFMLPSLYVDHVERENLDSIVAVQKGYIKERSYRNLTVKNPTGSVTLEVPLAGNTFYVAGKLFRAEIKAEDAEMQELLEKLRISFQHVDEGEGGELSAEDWEAFADRIFKNNSQFADGMFSLNVETSDTLGEIELKNAQTHMISDSLYVFEGGMKDGDNDYTNYIAFSQTDDALIFSILPVVTPQMTEIRPIVMESLPMIAAVVLFLVLVASQMFAKKIVNPVVRLANYAEEIKLAGNREVSPLEIRENDEIGELGNTLNELYARLRQQYVELEQKNEELEDKNQTLARENKRQEVFLRASSHQLKTPVTAALLLVEGMIAEVGKYKDTRQYLPEVKKQLKSMQKIVEDILYLNHCTEYIQKEPVEMRALVEELVAGYAISMEEKQLVLSVTGAEVRFLTDRELLKKILDNLLSNAVNYTPNGQKIQVEIMEKGLRVVNGGGNIESELMPHIYEPFVSSNTRQKGKGLGLYISAYYAEVLGFSLEIHNTSQGVEALLLQA